jgi:hypothetical protein
MHVNATDPVFERVRNGVLYALSGRRLNRNDLREYLLSSGVYGAAAVLDPVLKEMRARQEVLYHEDDLTFELPL